MVRAGALAPGEGAGGMCSAWSLGFLAAVSPVPLDTSLGRWSQASHSRAWKRAERVSVETEDSDLV